ncbi:protein-disulfide reductase DsbD family protein [Ramlibacter sp. MAHUQ-53]|uniref:protein-disulfide reductase DsbD family protein n=1 Tax=unclassified Ramlibacter TaxID=2617605 RepID=UPI0036333928
MTLIRFMLAALLAGLGAWAGPAAAQGLARSEVTTERVRAELVAHAPEGVAPGKPLWLGLRIAHQPEWHTYWKNPGDSGLATSLQWTLPPGLAAGEIDWPTPKKIPIGNLANYGYEGTVLLPVPVTVDAGFRPAPLAQDLEVRLKASWLVCRKECIPEEGEFALRVPLRGSTALQAAAFQAAWDARPRALAAAGAARVEGGRLKVTVPGLPADAQGRRLEVYPEANAIVEPAGAWTQAWQGAAWTADLPLSPMRADSPGRLAVVVADGARAWRTELAVAGAWPPVAQAAGVSPALQEALARNAAATPAGPPPSLLAALLGALVGGLILNLMPCVFPVLAIKVVGFARHAGDTRGHRLAGLAYTAGVLASFLALGALMLGLRAAGEQLGWGFQLQSPAMVATLAALFTVIGLNLAGVFEFGAMLPSRLAGLQARHPVADAFLSGVLAVAVASPCTAPFMGASLGLAIALPAAQALTVFAALGAGMALPYLAASWVPAAARLLPRPGAWMDTFRRFMAFPMFATVVWLVWVLGQQSGIDGAGALLALLVALALAVWAVTLAGRTRWVVGAIAAASLAALAWGLGPYVTRVEPAPATGAAAGAEGARWQPWSAERVRALQAEGRPVFVDFTAAWCVTCQYNKKTTLSDPAVLADLDQRRVALLRADWTRRDPAITAALAALGRSGVPVYVLHVPGRAPVVLSEILSAGDVRALLASL